MTCVIGVEPANLRQCVAAVHQLADPGEPSADVAPGCRSAKSSAFHPRPAAYFKRERVAQRKHDRRRSVGARLRGQASGRDTRIEEDVARLRESRGAAAA